MMAASGAFLMLAQREIPIGAAYVICTGIVRLEPFFWVSHFLGMKQR